ncbi:MFS transporter [Micromonospora endolithica]|uniref:MFS transporter n=1 Tax=Micromonospora endolithica TaxID=230091 RepID=A0A3A9ZG20_9ACTN|nr:MFS transporter [Micromonospora endolithica]RKN47492.1 MFS transporter [Micromonospora endolithica]TWJ21126.1 EmrB/QacA subfamily drug resistance transporter [Micromonospora endolithica]
MTVIQMRLATIGAVIAMVLGIIDTNVLATAVWPIATSLDPENGLQTFPWVITAYALAATVTQPLYGKLVDLHGPKRIFLFSLATFLIGSAACGLAQTMGQLIAFRAVQGVGGGGLMGVTLIMIMAIWPPEKTEEGGSSGGSGVGMGGVMVGVGVVVGPLVGGVIVDHLSWPWVFYVNVPLGIISWVLIATCLHLPDKESRERVDYLGAGLIAAGASAMLLIAEWGGRNYAWSSPQVVLLVVLAIVLMVTFLLRQGLVRRGALGRFAASDPIFPLTLFRNRVFRVASPQEFFAGMVITGSIVYVSLYLQAARGVDAVGAGLYLLPMALGMTVSGVAAGRFVRKPGRFKMLMVSGMGLVTVAMGLLSLLDVGTSTWQISVYLFLLGAGLGQVVGLALVAVQLTAPEEQMGVAITSVRLSQMLGGAIGSAIFGTVLARIYAANLPPALAATAESGEASAANLEAVPEAARPAVIDAVVAGTSGVFLTAAGIALLTAAITYFFFPEPTQAPAPKAGPPKAESEPEPTVPR